MFSYVMRQPGSCKAVIKELLPGIHVSDVVFKDVPETQKTIQGALGTHSVRLDVYLDDGVTVYNVEMQTGNKENLPKRARFYGSRIDCDQLEASADYNELRPTYVIFICTFDPFKLGQYVYSFRNRCEETPELELGDESYKVFFNTNGTKGEISGGLRQLLGYFKDPENSGHDTELIKHIDGIVDTANQDADWRRGYMTYAQAQMDARRQGWKEGKVEGENEGEFKKAKKVALSLYKAGIPLDVIAHSVEYSEKEVAEWLKLS